MRWLPYAATAAFSLAFADLFIKLASDKISSSLGGLVYGATTFLAALAWVGYHRATGQAFLFTPAGFGYALGVGIAFSGVTFFLYLAFSSGASVSVGSPAIRITAIFLTSLLGILVLREPFTLRYALGVILALGGIALIVFR